MAGTQKADTNVRWNEGRQVWEVRWTERDERGRPRSRAVSTGVKDIGGEHQAKVFEAEWRAQQKELTRATGEPRLAELIDAYLERAVARGFAKNRVWMLNSLKKNFGAHRVSALTMRDLNENFLARGFGPSTVYTHVSLVKTVVNHARRTRLLAPEVRDNIVLPRLPQGRLVFLDDFQESEFLAHAYGLSIGRDRLHPLTLFVGIALDTGARLSAILGLTWDRVRLDEGVIDFREPGRPVSGKRRAVAPINMRLRPLLERASRERKTGDRGDSALFKAKFIHRGWRTWTHKIGYPWVTPHVLRHTYITLTLKAGVEVSEVAELVADRPETIWKTYKHVKTDWLKDAADARYKKFHE